jgi:hypothetical protein
MSVFCRVHRAKFVGGGNFTPPATKQVTVQ